MTPLTVREADASLSELLDRVQAGHEVTITRDGLPVAVLVRSDALRVRRHGGAFADARHMHDLLIRARSAPLSTVAGMTEERAQDLVVDVRAGREAR